MKSLFAALLLSTPILASATTWDQIIDFNPNPQITPFKSYTFTHDLTTQGFNPGSDTVSNYNLTIDLLNDKGQLDVVYIDQPGNIFSDGLDILYRWNYASVTTQGSYEGVVSLNKDGTLNVTVASLFGTFFLDASELAANGTSGNSASVPEPTSVALLAVGLIGIAVMRRSSSR